MVSLDGACAEPGRVASREARTTLITNRDGGKDFCFKG
jgi:hypothetical protein